VNGKDFFGDASPAPPVGNGFMALRGMRDGGEKGSNAAFRRLGRTHFGCGLPSQNHDLALRLFLHR
jgi:hypothetical protein